MLSHSDTKSTETLRDYPKKKTTHYKEQNPEKVKLYQEKIKGIPPENIEYIDETGIDKYLFRKHSFAKKAKKYTTKSVEESPNGLESLQPR